MLKDQFIEQLDYYIDNQIFPRAGLCFLISEVLTDMFEQPEGDTLSDTERKLDQYFLLMSKITHDLTESIAPHWPNYSGNRFFPVPSAIYCLTAEEAYHLHAQAFSEYNLYAGVYGAYYKDFADFIKAQITEEQLENIKQQLEDLANN